MKPPILVAAGLLALPAAALAHTQGKMLHLADAPADQVVETLHYCAGRYTVTTGEGAPIEFREFDLRFKTDAGPNGPRPGAPVVINAGMRGDRAFVVFSDPDEMARFITKSC